MAGWVLWTVCLTLAFGRLAAYNLGNYRPVTNDEVELMSVAYKLATQGVLGSDLFAGFFGADQHFLINLPLQHLAEAISFRVFGTGVAQARWVSLIAGVSIVWLVGWLALRWYGLGTAILCELLLVAWPSDVTAAANSLPWFGVARTARYDVLAVAFGWLALALLDVNLRCPRAPCSLALGICCGLAAVSTFLGAFVLPLVILNWVWARGRRALAEPMLGWILAGGVVVPLLWAAFALRFPDDLAGQLSVYGGRGEFLRPSFYLANVVGEPSRYTALLAAALTADSLGRCASAWLLVAGIWPALGYLVWRRRRRRPSPGDRVVCSSLVLFQGLLLLFDQTKTPLYAIILFPSLCVALAAGCAGAFAWVHRQGQPAWLRLATGVLGLVLALAVGLQAVDAYQLSLTRAAAAGPYLEVGRQIEDSLAPDARVLGPERWWWALHAHPYLSLRSLWFQWTVAASRGPAPEFVDWVAWARADSVIVNDNVRGDVLDFPATLQQQFWTFLDTCTQRVADLDDPTYLGIQVYRITRPSPNPRACGEPVGQLGPSQPVSQ